MESNINEAYRQHNHTAYINILCFILMTLFGFTGILLPMYSFGQTIIWEITNALFVTACSLTCVQLADKKWIIPAAGYILLSISFIEFFTLLPINTLDKMEAAGRCGLLFLPAMIMISYYRLFPLWLRILGIISCLPFISIVIIADFSEDLKLFTAFFGAGYALIEITSVIWGIWFLKNLRKEQAAEQQSQLQ